MADLEQVQFGRRFSPDPRDHQYPIRALLEAQPEEKKWTLPWRYWPMYSMWRDQGPTGTCVGHAWAHWVEDGPVEPGHPEELDPFKVYQRAVQIDEWPENDNGDVNFGTSIRAGVEALVEWGYVTEYRWAWDLQTTIDAVMHLGPVVVGTNWYSGMTQGNPDYEAYFRGEVSPFDPQSRYLDVSGSFQGGHAYVLNGVSTKMGHFRMKNSWGRQWGIGEGRGDGGYSFIKFEDMERLIEENGDVCIATEFALADLPRF